MSTVRHWTGSKPFQACLAGIVVDRTMRGADVHVFFGRGPDVSNRHLMQYVPDPADGHPSFTWHWPDHCPWQR